MLKITTIFLLLWLFPLSSWSLSVQTMSNQHNSIVMNQVDQSLVDFHSTKTRQDILESRLKIVNVTCPELNNVTFTNEPPFDVLGLPQCGNKIEPQLILYLNDANKTECTLSLNNLPNNQTDHCFQLIASHSEINKLVLATHGFLNNIDTNWLHVMKDAILETEPHSAVMLLGWGRGIVEIFSYHTAAANTRYMSEALFQLFSGLRQSVPRSRNLYLHCAGHSLGSHVCGLTGKLLQSRGGFQFDRISAMDPAGPLFFNDVPYPWDYLNVTSASRLTRTDARLVDVIHTDGDARYLGYIPQYGTLESAGTVDFYPGTGKGAYGCYQPGCYDVFDVVACSHSRAHQYYIASIKDAACLASRVCHGDPKTYPDNCQNIRNTTRPRSEVTMGYWWSQANISAGSYTVEIKSTSPYCTN